MKLFAYFLFVIMMAGCIPSEEEVPHALAEIPALQFSEVDVPSAPGSGLPNLYADEEGRVWLSWVEKGEDGMATLRFSQREGTAWSAPRTIAAGDDWFVNWADFPSLIGLGDDAMAAHYLAKSGEGTYAYDVRLTQSADGGATWSNSLVPHDDGTQTEHGFVSMLPWEGDEVLAVWLDGRNTGGGEGHGGHGGHGGGAMTLRAAALDANGGVHESAELDARVCDCCSTSAARTANGAIVAYRDRSEEEIRDIAIVRLQDGKWSEPQVVHADGWNIEGCPVNGPVVAADGEQVAVAWFTAASETPRVKLAFSSDEGATFGDAMVVDDGQPIGRIDMEMLPDGSVLVSWVERVDEGAEIRVRLVTHDGTAASSILVAQTSPQRASGFPRLVRSGDQFLMAWTEAGDSSKVHAAVASLSE